MTRRILTLLFVFAIFGPLMAQTSLDTLKVGYTNAPPFIIQDGNKLNGVNIWLWKEIADDLELPYQLIPMDFTDMLSQLKAGTIDLSINPLTITSERSKKIGFTHPYYASNSTVAIYESSYKQKSTQFFNSIFNLKFLSGFFLLLLIIFLFGISTWYFERSVNAEQFRPGWKGIWDGLWWSIVTMTTVGYGDKSPKSRAGKMIALIWMFSGLLFISSFTASVASMLTVNQLQSNQNGFFEFKEKAVGCIQNSSTNEFLEERLFKDIRLYKNVNQGLDDLAKHEIKAFLYDEPILKYRINEIERYQHLKLLPIQFDLQLYAFGVPKNRPKLEKMISQKILDITESLKWQIILEEYGLSEI